jgi:hypothetical protein
MRKLIFSIPCTTMLVLDRTLSPSRSAGQFDDADESRRPRPRPRRMKSRSASPDRFLNLHTEYRQTALSLIPGRAHWSRLCKTCNLQLATCDYWICWDVSLLGCCDGEGAHAGGSSYASCRQRQSDGDLHDPINGRKGALTALTPSTPSTPAGRYGLFWNFFAPSEWPPRAARRVRKWLCQSSQRGRARICASEGRRAGSGGRGEGRGGPLFRVLEWRSNCLPLTASD